MTGAFIIGIIICKPSYWKEPIPIILLEVDKDSKVHFYHTIVTFGPAVSLKIEGGEESPLDSKEITKWQSKLQDK